jgi:hypothetical protein
MSFTAKPGGCEEQADIPGLQVYMPCNAPAVRIVKPKYRNEGPYRMCEMHADHSIKNRNFEDLGEYVSEL